MPVEHIVVMFEGTEMKMMCLHCNTQVVPPSNHVLKLVEFGNEFEAKHITCAKPMRLRPLTESDVKFLILAMADDGPVRGNAMASGDDALDKKVEDEILERLNQGDIWAWALVTVTASWTAPNGEHFAEVTHMGGCSYKNQAEFEADGSYQDLKTEVLDDLNHSLQLKMDALVTLT